MKLITEKFDLPVYWASALINGDYSGLNDAEEKQLKDWLESKPNLNCVKVSEETNFKQFAGVGSEVAEFTFIQDVTHLIPTKIEINTVPTDLLDYIDNVEIEPIVCVDASNVGIAPNKEDAHFWSVYVHFHPDNEKTHGVQCIADCPTEEDANKIYDLLLQVIKFSKPFNN